MNTASKYLAGAGIIPAICLFFALEVSGQEQTYSPQNKYPQISGVYPHLTMYAQYRDDGKYTLGKFNESGIGAVVPWAGKLWMMSYAPHEPEGSDHKLYSVETDMDMTIRPESVGGTPAGRMIHRESNQLFIGPYAIDSTGNVRVIGYDQMPGRLTAVARHLEQPADWVYYYDMEGKLYEVNVHTFEVNKLFDNPLPGWHGKGAYTSQRRLVVANNGESTSYEDSSAWKVKEPHPDDEEAAGVLASWDGKKWRIVERRQYTDVTGPGGLKGAPTRDAPLWSIGWDRRSLRLKLLDDGEWYTYLLPKAAHNNDPRHGWFTEWPRIRSVGETRMMMDMHGMFFDFPRQFSRNNTDGLKPISSHLRYIPDFAQWNGQLVLATDGTSIQGNPLAGQPQSNVWFGEYSDLKEWGPASGYGGPWVEDTIPANTPSDPFLIRGFDRRVLHLASSSNNPVTVTIEVDRQGDNNWEKYREVKVEGYVWHLFPDDLDAQWIRLRINRKSKITAYFHLTEDDWHDVQPDPMFDGLGEVGQYEKTSNALLYPAKRDRGLRFIARSLDSKGEGVADERVYDFTINFKFKTDQNDPELKELITPEKRVRIDEASVIIESDGLKLRLPKGNEAFDPLYENSLVRFEREVQSERMLANIHGTLYEVPLLRVGDPSIFSKMRPVASHNKLITDFVSWRGLLVLGGVHEHAQKGPHIYKAENGKDGLWFGAIDDLWKLGKPRGEGGPWKNTLVKAGEPSDPYLMTGYDQKTLNLSADRDVSITVEVNFDHQSGWHEYRTFDVRAGKTIAHEFPEGYSAHWVRTLSNRDAEITAWFIYE